jgi:hypothetical protein
MVKKIIVKKDESLAEIIDRVLDEPGKEVTVVIPKGSPLGKSVRNFHLLRSEAETAGKKVFVESPDEEIAEFAKSAGIESEPAETRVNGLADIVPVRAREHEEEDGEKSAARTGKRPSKKMVKLSVGTDDGAREGGGTDSVHREAAVNDYDQEEKVAAQAEKETFLLSPERFFKERKMADAEEAPEGERRRFPAKRIGIIAGIVVALIIVFYGVTAVFGRADIAINFKKTPWQYQGAFTADKAASSIDAAHNVLPAQLFTIPKNTTQLFPASAKQNVSVRAGGTLTIYNAYSSAAQQLVAATRFVTPDGKIFRLVAAVTVPGAQVTNGQIVPSSITTAVVADKPGPDYNVSAISKLTVPGFQGTPKYNGFYGALLNGTSGGFIGQKAVPTAADITNAKAKMTSILQAGLQTGLANTYPSNFKILDGATSVVITRLTMNTSTDQNGNFSVFGEATLQAIGFDEAAFKQHLLSLAQTTEPSSTFNSLTLNYSNVKLDFVNGRLTFSLAAQGALEPAFSADNFKAGIEGKSVSEARTAIASLPELQEGSISVWPAWVWNIPGNPGKINVMAN